MSGGKFGNEKFDINPEFSKSAVQRLVMPTAGGRVSYDVRVNCPHCNGRLALNQYPYNDDQTEYSQTEDELGIALFGTATEPATWSGLAIPYTCCKCSQPFLLSSMEP